MQNPLSGEEHKSLKSEISLGKYTQGLTTRTNLFFFKIILDL